jgi:GT2 family glycosyltransferase
MEFVQPYRSEEYVAEISIMIVTYNPGETIVACLKALPENINGLSVEVIVVDNASQDGTAAHVAGLFPHVRLLGNLDNPGYGIGNNRGFELSTGRYIVILNPDVVVRTGALDKLIDYLQMHPYVGIVGPRTFDSEQWPVITARHEYTVGRLLAKYLGLNFIFPSSVYGIYGSQSLKTDQPLDVDWLHGSALVIRRDVYEILGGFDENFFLFMEDVDLCIRAKEAGWRVVYLPTAEVEHVGSESVSRYPVARIRSYHISPLYYFRKRGQHSAVRILKAGFIVSLSLKTTLRRLQNLMDPNEQRQEKARLEWKFIKDVWHF